MASNQQPLPKWSGWTFFEENPLASVCGMVVVIGTLAFVVAITVFVAHDENSVAQVSGRTAVRLSAPEAAKDAASASRPQAGSGLGMLASPTEKDSALMWAAAQTPQLGKTVGKTPASLQAQDAPALEEPEAEEPADTQRSPSARRKAPPDAGPLDPRALGSSEVRVGARLASPSQAASAASAGQAAGGTIVPVGGDGDGAASNMPDGRPKLGNRSTANLRSASGTSPSGRKFANEGQLQRFATVGEISAGRFAADSRLESKIDFSRGIPQRNSPRVDQSEGAVQPGSAGADQQAVSPAVPDAAGADKASATEYRYGPHERNVLDFYPAATSGAPLVVFFHGGGFVGGDKSHARGYLSFMDGGYAMASCNYRLISSPSQASKIALAAYDARNAVRWLRDNAGMLGVDPKRFVAVGASAGGYLAAMLGSAGNARLSDSAISGTSPSVQVVIDLAGPTDFGGKVIAPMQFVDGSDPPTFIRHGRNDKIVSFQHSLGYAAKLRGAGVTVDVKIMDGVGHTVPPALQQQLLQESMAFVSSNLR